LSEDKKSVEELFAGVGADGAVADAKRKHTELWVNKVDVDYEDFKDRQDNIQKIQNIDKLFFDKDRIKKVQEKSREYLKQAKNSKMFICNSFKGQIPYFARNLILIAAQTGDGKSTTSANLAYHAITQGQRVLMMVNEESADDVYNRVSCLCEGWSYVNHDQFKEHQIDLFDRNIASLANRLVVVDDSFNDNMGQTSTLEGVTGLLSSLVNSTIKFDVIIIDYYQNVDSSVASPSLKDWEVQSRFASFLDKFKNSYNAPIVLMAQKKKQVGDKAMTFKESIEGRKVILNKATCAISVTAERDLQRTAWEITKSRFNQAVGEVIYTGFDRGKYVEYTEDFMEQAQQYKERKEIKEDLKKKQNADVFRDIKPKS